MEGNFIAVSAHRIVRRKRSARRPPAPSQQLELNSSALINNKAYCSYRRLLIGNPLLPSAYCYTRTTRPVVLLGPPHQQRRHILMYIYDIRKCRVILFLLVQSVDITRRGQSEYWLCWHSAVVCSCTRTELTSKFSLMTSRFQWVYI